MMRILTPSQKFILFWLLFIAGIVVGSKFSFSLSSLFWLGALWLLVWLSGQEEKIEITALSLSGLLTGLLLWQLTTGEIWLHLKLLGQLSESLTHLRDSLIDKIFLALPEPHGSLLSGILFGNRTKLDPGLIQSFRTVGLSHIIAVSGYNLTILTAYSLTLLRPYFKQKAVIVALLIIVVFVLLTGASSSVLRAAVMSSALLLATALGRPNRSVNTLLVAAGVLAIFEPKIVFDIGFQLSVAATYGLVRLSPLIDRAITPARLPKTLRRIISETLAATLLTAPLIVTYFERISLISPVVNLLVLPFIPMLMGLGFAGVITLMIYSPLGNLVTLLSWPVLQWIIWITKKSAALPFASNSASLSGWQTLLLMGMLIISLELLNKLNINRSNKPLLKLAKI